MKERQYDLEERLEEYVLLFRTLKTGLCKKGSEEEIKPVLTIKEAKPSKVGMSNVKLGFKIFYRRIS